MPRPEKPITPGVPAADLAHYLRKLRNGAGRPSYRELAARSHYSASRLAEAASGQGCPKRELARAFAEACGADATQLRVLDELWHKAMRADVAARSHLARQRRGRNDVWEASMALRRLPAFAGRTVV